MFTYNSFWKSDKAFLVYPENETKLYQGRYYNHLESNNIFHLEANILFVNIFKDNTDELDSELGERVFEMVTGKKIQHSLSKN